MTKAHVFELTAKIRDDLGKGASRRLRRIHGAIPAILYGGNEAPMPITLDHKKITRVLENEAFYSHVLEVNIEGISEQKQVVLKHIQRHPYKRAILHMDFQRVTDSDLITMDIPIHFINEDKSPGFKDGGLVHRLLNHLEIQCIASKLPEYIEVNLAGLKTDHSIHTSDIILPAGSTLPASTQAQNLPIVSIHMPRSGKTEDEPTADLAK